MADGPAPMAAAEPRAGAAFPLRTVVLANLGFLAAVTLWGTFFPAIELILRGWDVISATVARHSLAVLALFAVLTIRDREFPLKRHLPWRRLMALGLIGMTATSFMTTLAIFLSSGVSAAIVSASNPITSVLIARLLIRLPLMPGIVIGTALSTAGGLIAILGADGGGAPAEFRGGEILIVIQNLGWTWYSIMAQRWLAGYSQLHITALTSLTGLLGLYGILALAALTGAIELRAEFSALTILLLCYIGPFAVAGGNFLWHFGVSRVGVAIGALYNNLIPVAAVLVTIWAGQPPSPAQLLGGAVIVAGVLYAQVRASRRAGRG
jgi:drug/metabolite transporter (DMT)-like permease